MEGCCWRLVGGGVCQLFDFPAFRLVDLLGSRKVGELAGCGGFLVYRRGKRASAQEGQVQWKRCCRGGTFSRARWWVPVLVGGAAGRGEDQVAGAGGYRAGRLAALRRMLPCCRRLGGALAGFGLPGGGKREKEAAGTEWWCGCERAGG